MQIIITQEMIDACEVNGNDPQMLVNQLMNRQINMAKDNQVKSILEQKTVAQLKTILNIKTNSEVIK